MQKIIAGALYNVHKTMRIKTRLSERLREKMSFEFSSKNGQLTSVCTNLQKWFDLFVLMVVVNLNWFVCNTLRWSTGIKVFGDGYCDSFKQTIFGLKGIIKPEKLLFSVLQLGRGGYAVLHIFVLESFKGLGL